MNTNENKVFKAICENIEENSSLEEFGFSGEVVEAGVEGLTQQQVKGYISSLLKKGLIEIDGCPTEYDDNQMMLTPKGLIVTGKQPHR